MARMLSTRDVWIACATLALALSSLTADAANNQQGAPKGKTPMLRTAPSTYVAVDIGAGLGIWGLLGKTPTDQPVAPFLSSRVMGENMTGVVESPRFTLGDPRVRVKLCGWDTHEGDAGINRCELIAADTGDVLRTMAPPLSDAAKWAEWDTADLAGREVFVRLTDGDANHGYAWFGMEAIDAGKSFQASFVDGRESLKGWMSPGAEPKPRDLEGIMFNAAANTPLTNGNPVQIELGYAARRLFFLGLSNSIDQGCPVWYPLTDYGGRYFIGDSIGEVRIGYADGVHETYPLILGDAAWWGGAFNVLSEPFASQPDLLKVLEDNLRVYPAKPTHDGHRVAFIEPRPVEIRSLELISNPEKWGAPVILGVTAEVAAGASLPADAVTHPVGELSDGMKAFLAPKASKAMTPEGVDTDGREARLDALRNLLYTTHENFPKSVPPSRPEGYRGPEVTFEGDEFAQVLTNVFYHNLYDMDLRVDERGMHHTSADDAPSWGGYTGFGTWFLGWGSYNKHCWARDMGRAIVELTALGLVDKGLLNADYCFLMGRVWEEGEMPEMELYESHGMVIGPFTNEAGDPLPYHWSRILNIPGTKNGAFDNDSHGLTMLGIYNTWRRMPGDREAWVRERWQWIEKGAGWIKWQFDNPDKSGATDLLIHTDSESSGGWGYSIYPDYTCMEGLRGFAEMADSIGKTEEAAEWRATADRLRRGMARDYKLQDDKYGDVWTLKSAGWPHHSTVLAPVILATDRLGLAPEDGDQPFRAVTEASYQRLIDVAATQTPFGAYGAAMGYSQGFVNQTALLLDRMGEAEEMLRWTARLIYYNCPTEAWRYLVPEGAEIIPSGEYWHRIGDLGNAVQQAETIKTLRLVIGVDDAKQDRLRLFPRMPMGWTRVAVSDFPAWLTRDGAPVRVALEYDLVREGNGLKLTLGADRDLGDVEVRLGALSVTKNMPKVLLDGEPVKFRVESSGDAQWVRVELENVARGFTLTVEK